MTLTILNNEFVPIVLIDDFNSFIWTDRYNTIGDFELVVPYKEEYNFLLQITKTDKYYLQCTLSEHLMFIKKVQISYDPEDGYLIQLEGLSLESILEQRIIFPQTILTGSLHNGIKKLITNNIISPYNPDIEGPTANRQISNFIFVDSTDSEILAMRNRSQYTGDNLYETISQLCQLYGLGFKVLLNQSTGNFEFSLYRGEDRSFNQSTNSFILFTPKLENLNSMERITDYSGYKNAFWAAGEEAAVDRVNIYTVSDENPDTVAGLDLKEIYVDARDIQNQDGEITDEDYYNELKKRGSEKLSEYSITTAISGEVQYKTNFEYNKDYFIGDIVQLDDGLGNQAVNRITEQIISYNKEGLSLYPTFTEDNATTDMSSGGTGMITKNEYYTKQEVDSLLSGKVSKAGDTMTGALSMAGVDINLKTPGSSSNDSGDIVWYYGNGREKARLWTNAAYTAESGLNFRMYKEDGTSLFSGTIPLRDTNTTYTIATGDSNGQIKITPSSGSAYNVSVKGLGNAAYIGTPVSIANGGTGKTTAADARTALSTPAMTTETYPALLPTNGSNNWIKIGTSNTSYGILPSQAGGSTGGHNFIGTSTWYWGYAYVQDIFCNKIQATSTQDASGTANNKPALIVGGSDTQAHIEIDGNEIIAKSNGNTAGTLYLQDGGTLALSATSYSVSNAANFRSAISAQATLSTTTTTPAGAALAKYGNVVWLPIWGVAGNNIGTIPAAYRPKVPARALVYCIVNGATYVGVAEVNTSGVFNCWYYKTYGSGTSTAGNNASTKVYGEMVWITA